MAVFQWGGAIAGVGRKESIEGGHSEAVEIEKGQRQGFWDVVHRRPLSQTVDELGDLAKGLK